MIKYIRADFFPIQMHGILFRRWNFVMTYPKGIFANFGIEPVDSTERIDNVLNHFIIYGRFVASLEKSTFSMVTG